MALLWQYTGKPNNPDITPPSESQTIGPLVRKPPGLAVVAEGDETAAASRHLWWGSWTLAICMGLPLRQPMFTPLEAPARRDWIGQSGGNAVDESGDRHYGSI